MSNQRGLYEQSIERMQQSIDRLENQLERSKQFLSHDISVDNRTQKDIRFTIRVSQDEQNQFIQSSQSKLNVPQYSSIRHRISSTPRDYSGSPIPSQEHQSVQKNRVRFTYNSSEQSKSIDRDKNSTLYIPSTPTGRQQRKFQPFHSISKESPEPFQENHRRITEPTIKSHFENQSVTFSEHRFRENSYSDTIGQQGRINELESFSPQRDLSLDSNSIIPLSITEQKKDNPPIFIDESPEVFNYLKQKNVPINHQDYTPMNKVNDISVTFSSDNQKIHTESLNVAPSVEYKKNKTYFDGLKDKETFMKNKREERRKRLEEADSRSKEKQYKYISKFQYPRTNKKVKADDLFLERKNLFLKKLKKNNEKTAQKVYGRSKSKSNPILMTQRKTSPAENHQKKKQMSPRVRQISQRLYSRSKQKLVPCKHYKRHSQSIQRGRFFNLVHENSFVRKYVSNEEQQSLFQQFRRSQDSVSSWPMKLLNYTYSKLKRINTNRYTISKVPL